jgi:uncharacterized membrane protein
MANPRLRWLLAACLLLVVLVLVGHFVTDLFTDSLDTLLTIDLHSGFWTLPSTAFTFVLSGASWVFLPPLSASGWRHPPQTPPPLSHV